MITIVVLKLWQRLSPRQKKYIKWSVGITVFLMCIISAE